MEGSANVATNDASLFDVAWCREQFPALSRLFRGKPVVHFDGPAGTQVARRVVDAVGRYLVHNNANGNGLFVTSRESDTAMAEARQAMADLLGAGDPETIVFGPNMTSLTFALSCALAKTWQPGDHVVLTRLEHDANVTPWVMAARQASAHVEHVSVRREDGTLNMDDLAAKLSRQPRLVAVTGASNALGSLTPLPQIVRLAHDAGALVFVDGVHLAPHRLIDVERWGCDFLACSVYKFFGPHVGVLWGRRELMAKLPACKLRPVPDTLPSRWMHGTPNQEGIAGASAAVEYLAALGRHCRPEATGRRAALEAAFEAIAAYERRLSAKLLSELAKRPEIKVWGITDPARLDERVPTLALTHRRLPPRKLAADLGNRGIFVWHGNFYALPLTEALGLEPEGVLRVGLVHYNTGEEIDRLMETLDQL